MSDTPRPLRLVAEIQVGKFPEMDLRGGVIRSCGLFLVLKTSEVVVDVFGADLRKPCSTTMATNATKAFPWIRFSVAGILLGCRLSEIGASAIEAISVDMVRICFAGQTQEVAMKQREFPSHASCRIPLVARSLRLPPIADNQRKINAINNCDLPSGQGNTDAALRHSGSDRFPFAFAGNRAKPTFLFGSILKRIPASLANVARRLIASACMPGHVPNWLALHSTDFMAVYFGNGRALTAPAHAQTARIWTNGDRLQLCHWLTSYTGRLRHAGSGCVRAPRPFRCLNYRI